MIVIAPDNQVVEGPRPGAWQNSNFRLLWVGQSFSWTGTQITQLALPLVAVILLDGSPLQVSLVLAFEFLPALLFGAVAGVWVDRLDRRQVLIFTDIGRFLSLLAIPLLHWTDHLEFAYLYLAVFVTGLLSVAYNAAYQALLPSIVEERDLLDANGKLEMSRSIAQGAGPGFGGVLVQALSAPVAVVTDAATYLVSAAAALRMKTVRGGARPGGGSFRSELAEGVKVILGEPVQWRLALAAAVDNFFAAGVLALYVLYAKRDLDLSALLIGIVLGVGAVGAVGASTLLRRLGRRVRPKQAIIAGALARGVGYALVPLADGATALIVLLLCAGQILAQGGMVVLVSSATTWRQLITPNHLMGRVVAASMTVLFGAIPFGAAFSGVLADVAGTRLALAVGAAGTLCSALVMIGTRNPAPPAA
ncbi:MFS transporter, partial [Actinomadura rubrisoli]|uniref:MFS transporter n=1 Tax=Actinomadura rubrisoli TaxID=2530368 RepID=UPI00104B83C3